MTTTSARPDTEDFYGWETDSFTRDPHVVTSSYLLIFALLIVTCTVIQHMLAHLRSPIKKYLPEAAATMLVGMLVGGIIRVSGGYDQSTVVSTTGDVHEYGYAGSSSIEGESFDPTFLGFNSHVFFFGFLPAIIFNSGYHLKRRY